MFYSNFIIWDLKNTILSSTYYIHSIFKYIYITSFVGHWLHVKTANLFEFNGSRANHCRGFLFGVIERSVIILYSPFQKVLFAHEKM